MKEVIYFQELKKTPRNKAIEYKYSKKVIEFVSTLFPEKADAIASEDERFRSKRLFGSHYHVVEKEGKRKAIKLMYQNGVLKMYLLGTEENGSGSEITVWNDSVYFGKDNKNGKQV